MARVLCILSGTFLINLAALLGFPPFFFWVRMELVVDQLFILIVMIFLLSHLALLVALEDWQRVALVLTFAGIIRAGIKSIVGRIGEKDIPGRQKAAEELRHGLPDAAALLALRARAEEQQGGPAEAAAPLALPHSRAEEQQHNSTVAHTSLLNALHVFARRYKAIMERDMQRQRQVEHSIAQWKALPRRLCMWVWDLFLHTEPVPALAPRMSPPVAEAV